MMLPTPVSVLCRTGVVFFLHRSIYMHGKLPLRVKQKGGD
jgi:hypothetical protein